MVMLTLPTVVVDQFPVKYFQEQINLLISRSRVVVTMVKVRHVGMRVHQRVVAMRVLVTRGCARRVDVVVVAVIVPMFVVVLDRFMGVVVLVIAAQHKADADRSDQ